MKNKVFSAIRAVVLLLLAVFYPFIRLEIKRHIAVTYDYSYIWIVIVCILAFYLLLFADCFFNVRSALKARESTGYLVCLKSITAIASVVALVAILVTIPMQIDDLDFLLILTIGNICMAICMHRFKKHNV